MRARRRDRVDTEHRILDAATDLFAKRGYGSTTVRAIAAHAGAHPSQIHRYFGDKAGLLAAVLYRLTPLPAPPRIGPKDGLQAVVTAMVRSTLLWPRTGSHRSNDRLLLALWSRSLDLDETSALFGHGVQDRIVADLAAAIDDSTRLRSTIAIAIIIGFLTARDLLRDPVLAAAPSADAARVLARGLHAVLTTADR